jgi:gamma-resorcylate decarboxylase
VICPERTGTRPTIARASVVLPHPDSPTRPRVGELLPFNIWRTDHRLGVAPRGLAVRHTFGHYLRTNFYLTTSGNFRTPALLNALQEVGADRLLFSADYPFEDMREAATWFDRIELNDTDLHKIAPGNARRLFRF